ncbi:Decarboxylase [Pleurostoma richardsiae]|uniref:Decarboxylase n=1 Tax=Pleurostoma richardsiae TaxID=41990 RepID=A0AA38R7G5_9PEZI|nr:Decarboxylase [Pleurostoma richardsiae]
MPSTESHLAVDSWTLWGIGMATVICRLASRRMLFGSFKKYQLDDYLMMLAAISFTGVVVSSNQVAINGSNYVSDEVVAQFTPQERNNAEWGSKMLLALEQFQLATIWLVKACLLLLYARMTSGLNEGIAVKALAVYCAVGYVIIQVLYLGVWCRPIYYYWAVPVPHDHPQCKSYHNHMITVTVLNVSSDLAMLCVPVPLIARAHLPLKRKLVLCVVFSLGALVVLVAILNRYFNFTTTNDLVFLVWYNGEASTAVMIANIPFCWTLLRRLFALDAWGGYSSNGRGSRTRTAPPPPMGSGRIGGMEKRRRGPHSVILGVDMTESMERIADSEGERGSQHELRSMDQRDADSKSWAQSQTSDVELGGVEGGKRGITKTVTIEQSWKGDS